MRFEHGIELLQKTRTQLCLFFFCLLTKTICLLRGSAGLVRFHCELLLLSKSGLARCLGFSFGLGGLLRSFFGLLAHVFGFGACGFSLSAILLGLLAAQRFCVCLGAGLGFAFRGFTR
jgi:hypothetical protein